MGSLIMAAMICSSALSVNASNSTIGPFNGPVCPSPGPVYVKPTPACGATTLHAGFFKPGRFQRVYERAGNDCISREIFLGCA